MSHGLTTHVLDLTKGIPAAHLKVELWQILGVKEGRKWLGRALTNKQGRIESGLLDEIVTGEYEMIFFIGKYYQTSGTSLSDPIFFNEVPVRIGLSGESQHYHIPLLISPWGYQTYRGS